MKLMHVLNELVATEKSYIQSLNTIEGVREYLLQNASKLEPLVATNYIKGLEIIHMIRHKQGRILNLFESLREQFLTDTELAAELNMHAIASLTESLEMELESLSKDYANYAIFFDNFINNMSRTVSSPKTDRKLRKASGKTLGLNDYLVMPVQRFMRYPMLLNELSKAFPDMHPAKESIQGLLVKVSSASRKINAVSDFYANVKNPFPGVIHGRNTLFSRFSDTQYRRQVKSELDAILNSGTESGYLEDLISKLDLTVDTKHFHFSNKREYRFINNSNQTIFKIIVNRHTMSFQFTPEFDSLTADEKVKMFRLQYFISNELEKRIRDIQVDDTTIQHLNILGEVDYLASTSEGIQLKNDDVDEDDDISVHSDVPVSKDLARPSRSEAIATDRNTLLFRNHLNDLVKRNPTLVNQGSFLKVKTEEGSSRYAKVTRIKLPGM